MGSFISMQKFLFLSVMITIRFFRDQASFHIKEYANKRSSTPGEKGVKVSLKSIG